MSAIWRWNARRLFRLRTLPWLLSVLALVLVLRTVPLADILAVFRRLRGWEIVVITRLQVDFQLRPAILLALAIGLLALPLAYLAASWLGIRPFTALFLRWPADDRSLRYQKVLRLVQEAEAQVSDFYRQRPRTLVLALLFAAVTWVAMVGEYWLAARFLGLPYTLWQAIAALTAARFAFLLPLPAGLGVLEASQAFAAAALGYDPAAGVALALLIRARDVVLALLGAWLATRYLA